MEAEIRLLRSMVRRARVWRPCVCGIQSLFLQGWTNSSPVSCLTEAEISEYKASTKRTSGLSKLRTSETSGAHGSAVCGPPAPIEFDEDLELSSSSDEDEDRV